MIKKFFLLILGCNLLLTTNSQYLSKNDSMQLTNASIWGVCNDEGDSLLITTIRTVTKPNIYMRKVLYTDITRQSTPIALTTDADFTSISNLTDHKSMVLNNEIYVAFSTQGDTDLFLFKTDINGTRIGSIVTLPTTSGTTNDMVLTTDGTYIYVLHFNAPDQQYVYTYDNNLIQQGTRFSTATLSHNNIGQAIIKNGQFYNFTGSSFGLLANLILTKWSSAWAAVSSTTLITESGGDGYYFSTGIAYDATNLKWYIALNHKYSTDASDHEHIDLCVFDTNFVLQEQQHITGSAYFRPHLTLHGGYLYLTYDYTGSNKVYLIKYNIGGNTLAAYSTQPTATVAVGQNDVPLAGFSLTPYGSIDFTAVTVTGSLTTTSDISNVRIYRDNNGDGLVNGADASVSGTGISFASSMSFTLSSQTGFSSVRDYLIVGDIGAGATSTTVALSISSGNYTTSGSSNIGSMSSCTRIIYGLGVYRSAATGSYSVAATWETWNGSTWSVPGSAPAITDNVFVISPYTVTIDADALNAKNIFIESGATLYSNQSSTRPFNFAGNIICNGTIGTGSTYDGLVFVIKGGTTSTISGSGTFDAARITNAGAGNVTLTLSMNINLRFSGTGIYNNTANTIFNLTVSSGYTLSLPGDGTSASGGALSIDGTDGAGAGDQAGTFTINGTVTVSGGATSSPIVYMKSNNTGANACVITIGSAGTLSTVALDCGASGSGGHGLTLSNGASLTITGEPTSFITPTNTNNSYNFGSTSTITYSKAGAQTIYTFGGSVNLGNITLSGSGNKSVPADGTLKALGLITTGGFLVLKSNSGSTATLSGNGGVSGNATIERYLSSGTRKFRFLGFPFISGVKLQDYRDDIWLSGPGTGSGALASNNYNSNGFHYTTGNNASVFTYYDSLNSGASSTRWSAITSTGQGLTSGKGYRILFRGPISQGTSCIDGTSPSPNEGTLSAAGVVKTGAQTFSVKCSNGCVNVPASNNNDGWNMVGNPYPCTIDWNAASGWTKTNIQGTIWVWNPTTNSYGNWNGASSTNSVTGYIASGQAFFVRSTNSTTALSCTESVKTTSSAAYLFKGANENLMRIQMVYDMHNSDECIVQFLAGKSDNYVVDEEVEKFMNTDLNIYSIPQTSKTISVNYLNEMQAEKEYQVKLGVNGVKASYKLLFPTLSSFTGTSMIFKDKFLNNTVILSETNKEYNFSITDDVNSYGDDRFEILFKKSNTAVMEQDLNKPVLLYPNPAREEINLALTTGNKDDFDYALYNNIGEQIAEGKLNFGLNTNQKISVAELPQGMYYLKITNANIEQSFKVIK